MAVRSLNELKVAEGQCEAFKAAYLENGFLQRAIAASGFISGELLIAPDKPNVFVKTTLWETEAAYSRWQLSYLDRFIAAERQPSENERSE
ncbi:MAG: antibiotic biosynthesis monooxygenase [Hyphomonadaceae bacterium]